MKLKYLYILCICCFCFSISAQDVGRIDIIILNDGSTIKGTVLEDSEESTIIKMTSGTEISLPTNSIEKVRPGKENLTYFTNGKARKEIGYFGFIKTGILFPKLENYYWDSGATLNTVHGYRFNKNLAVGLGIGIDNYEGINVIPLYAHIRYEPWGKKVRPYISLDAGYGFPTGNDNFSTFDGGALLQPAIGLQFSARTGGGMFIEWGQKFQWIQRSFDDWWSSSSQKEMWRLSRTGLTFGYQF